MAGIASYALSNDPRLNALLMSDTLSGGRAVAWDSRTITYSFPTDGSYYLSHWEYIPGAGVIDAIVDLFKGEAPDSVLEYTPLMPAVQAAFVTDWSPFTTAQQNAVRSVVANIEAVTQLDLVEQSENLTSHADMRFGSSALVGLSGNDGLGIPPALVSGPMAGDVWIDEGRGTPVPGNGDYWLIMHETLHALGLKHGHEDGVLSDGVGSDILGGLLDHANGDDWGFALPSQWDSPEFTVMTYRDYEGGPANENSIADGSHPQTLMMLDIAALQHLYGADFTTNSTSTVYRWDPNTGARFVNGVSQGDLDPANNVVFETIWDGGGVDTYDFSNYTTNLDVSLEPGGWSRLSRDGNQQIASLGPREEARANVFNALQYRGDMRSLIENATGGAGNDNITGNAVRNVLTGNDGADTLRGGGDNDTLIGGLGRDSLFGEAGNDTLKFARSPVVSTSGGLPVVYWLPDVISGEVIDGGGDRDTIALRDNIDFSGATIRSIEQVAFEASGTATFNARQFGAGALSPTLMVDGSGGADVFAVNLQGAPAVLLGDLTFTDWRDEDRVEITGSAGADIIGGTDVADIIFGRGGSDRIGGGLGADRVHGGAGDDRLEYEAAAVSVGEIIDGGSDRDTLVVRGEVNFIPFREGLTIISPTGPITSLIPSPVTIQSVERLEFATNYVNAVNSAQFSASHFAAPGLAATLAVSGTAQTDKLFVTMGESVNLDLSQITFANWSSSDSVTITGDADGETIVGTRVADVIRSGGGSDLLTGGAGLDTFVFASGLGAAQVDTIRDFSVRDDTIHLDNAVMAGLGTATGTLAAMAFVTGAVAADATDRVIYNRTSGDLFYDADGTGATAAIKIAQLSAGLAMTHQDFVIV